MDLVCSEHVVYTVKASIMTLDFQSKLPILVTELAKHEHECAKVIESA